MNDDVQGDERRDNWRIKIAAVIKRNEDGEEITSYTEDFGGGGLRFLSDQQFDDGETIKASIPRYKKDHFFSGTVIDSVKIMHSNDYRTRVQWDNPNHQDVLEMLNMFLDQHTANVKHNPDDVIERRAEWRIHVDVGLQLKGEKILHARSEDIGGGGMRIISPKKLEKDEIIELGIPGFNKDYTFTARVLDCNDVEFIHEFQSRIEWVDADPDVIAGLLNFLYDRHITKFGM